MWVTSRRSRLCHITRIDGDHAMKRLLLLGLLRLVVFGLLGSAIFAVLCAADFVFVSFGAKFSRDNFEIMLLLIPSTFMLGISYGLLTGLIDFALLRAKLPYRMTAVALVGVAAMNYMFWDGEWLQGLCINLIGCLPAALCSLLCERAPNTRLVGRWLSPVAARSAALPAE
jgi:hypothetical protein